MFCSTSFFAPEANSKIRLVPSAGKGALGVKAVKRSPSSVRSGPFAVPSSAQNAGALALIVAVVFQLLSGTSWLTVTGTWVPVDAASGIRKSTVYDVGLELGIRLTAIIAAESEAIFT